MPQPLLWRAFSPCLPHLVGTSADHLPFRLCVQNLAIQEQCKAFRVNRLRLEPPLPFDTARFERSESGDASLTFEKPKPPLLDGPHIVSVFGGEFSISTKGSDRRPRMTRPQRDGVTYERNFQFTHTIPKLS